MKAKIRPKKDCKCRWKRYNSSVEETVVIDQLHTRVFCLECGGYMGFLRQGSFTRSSLKSEGAQVISESVISDMSTQYEQALQVGPPVVNVRIDPTAEPSVTVDGRPMTFSSNYSLREIAEQYARRAQTEMEQSAINDLGRPIQEVLREPGSIQPPPEWI